MSVVSANGFGLSTSSIKKFLTWLHSLSAFAGVHSEILRHAITSP
jgi:hypothetical protein